MIMLCEAETLDMKSNKYYRDAAIVIEKSHDRAFAFTMRLLNFLGTLDTWKAKSTISPYGVERYAERMTKLARLKRNR